MFCKNRLATTFIFMETTRPCRFFRQNYFTCYTRWARKQCANFCQQISREAQHYFSLTNTYSTDQSCCKSALLSFPTRSRAIHTSNSHLPNFSTVASISIRFLRPENCIFCLMIKIENSVKLWDEETFTKTSFKMQVGRSLCCATFRSDTHWFP